MIKSCLLMLCSIFICFDGNAATIVKHAGPEDNVDPRKGYFIELLDLALSKSEEKFGPYRLIQSVMPMYQDRQKLSLKKNHIDVLWTATSKQREKEMLAVKFPLMQGLLGFRVLVINKKNVALFNSIDSTSKLKNLVAVQGHDWPDLRILKHNDFTVFSSTLYNKLFEMMEKSKFDYFPRSILEARGELEQLNSNLVQIDKKHLIVYSTAIYFFVNKNNTKLADRLLTGLQLAKEDGSYDYLLRNHVMHKKALDEFQLENRLIHRLENPYTDQGFVEVAEKWLQENTNTN